MTASGGRCRQSNEKTMSARIELPLILTGLVLLSAPPGLRADENKPSVDRQLGEARRVLQDSDDPCELECVALQLCDRGDEAALRLLTSTMLDPLFVGRLDPGKAYEGYRGYHRTPLRINRVAVALGKVGTPPAEASLLALTKDRAFLDHAARVDGLVEASGWISKPSARLLEWLDTPTVWRGRDQRLAVRALARLGSRESVAIIEKRLRSDGPSPEDKILWFTSVLVRFRNAPAIVGLYHRVLASGVSEPEVRDTIVQCLFEYDPKEWHGDVEPWYGSLADLPRPQDAPADVLRELLDVAELAAKLDLPRETKDGVRRAREGAAGVLRGRESEHSPERIARLIADLDDDKFAARERASAELERLGLLAEDALRRAARNDPPPELRSRLAGLLAKLEGQGAAPFRWPKR